MAKQISLVVKEDEQTQTYTFTDNNNEIVINWIFNINRLNQRELTINIEGTNRSINPFYYYINELIISGKINTLNDLSEVIITNDKSVNRIDITDIDQIQSSHSDLETRVAIIVKNFARYPELIGPVGSNEEE